MYASRYFYSRILVFCWYDTHHSCIAAIVGTILLITIVIVVLQKKEKCIQMHFIIIIIIYTCICEGNYRNLLVHSWHEEGLFCYRSYPILIPWTNNIIVLMPWVYGCLHVCMHIWCMYVCMYVCMMYSTNIHVLHAQYFLTCINYKLYMYV